MNVPRDVDNPLRLGIKCNAMSEMQTPQDKAPARARVRELLATGHTPRAIAESLGITTQAVYKHMDALKEAANVERSSN